MKISSASQGIKKGVPKNHTLAEHRTIEFWNNNRSFQYKTWVPTITRVEHYSQEFIKKNWPTNKSGKDHFEHHCDIAFITIDTEDYNFYDVALKLIIEIDGERHSSKNVQINDKIFEKWIQEHYHNTVPVIRLQKSELIGPENLAEQYLKQELKDYI